MHTCEHLVDRGQEVSPCRKPARFELLRDGVMLERICTQHLSRMIRLNLLPSDIEVRKCD